MEQESARQTTLVIFGITGHLAQTKILPALAAVEHNGQLPTNFKLLGVSRRNIKIADVLPKACLNLSNKIDVLQMDVEKPADYRHLKIAIRGSQAIFYIAVPPTATMPIIRELGENGLNNPSTKILLEKPFGVDYRSAKQLITQTNRYFKEKQIYRIDHYLAKEMAQNIAVFLGGNVLFRDVWDRNYIDRIEVTATERIGVEGRASFYEQTGALRDFVQSHLLQLLALVLMEPCPDVFDFSEVSARRLKALSAIEPADPKHTIRAQYSGYAKEVGNPGSTVETFVQLELISKDPKWEGVQLSLATGKALNRKYTAIKIYFKKAQVKEANLLTLRIQPKEGIELDLWIKKPGYNHAIQKLSLDFSYKRHFKDSLPDAYEQVLVDAMRGSQNLFASGDEVLASWAILEPLIKAWRKNSKGLKYYQKGDSALKVARSRV